MKSLASTTPLHADTAQVAPNRSCRCGEGQRPQMGTAADSTYKLCFRNCVELQAKAEPKLHAVQGVRKWAEDSGAKAGDEMALKRRDGQVWVRRIAALPERTPSAGKRKRAQQEGLPGRATSTRSAYSQRPAP